MKSIIQKAVINIAPLPNPYTPAQKTAYVKALQENIAEELNNTGYKVSPEFDLFSSGAGKIKTNDKADIYASNDDEEIIIELDTIRADQVAKKALSRFCFPIVNADNRKFIYVALLYPGTNSMNGNECQKYFHYASTLLKNISIGKRQVMFIGGIIDKNTGKVSFYY